MKKKYYITGLFAIIVALLFTACKDDINDWDVDKSKSQMFTPVFFETSRLSANSAELRYSKVPNHRSYIIEVSKDSLEFNTIEQSIEIKAEEMTLDSTSSSERYLVNILNLEASTRYSARIKATSNLDLPDSKWADITFKLPGEQIVSSYTYGEDNATLSWEPGLVVTHYVIFVNDEEEGVRKELTPDEIERGSVELLGLIPNTQYTIHITNGTKVRGSATFKTFPQVSGDGTRFYLEGNEDIVEYLNNVTDQEVVLVLPAGSTYNIDATWLIPSHITSLTLWGLPSTSEPQAYLRTKEIRLDPTVTNFKIWVQNIHIEGTDASADYVINDKPTSPRNIGLFRMENCTVHTFRGIFRTNGSVTVDLTEFNSCEIYNVSDYGVINSHASSVFKDVNIKNTTIHHLNNTNVLAFRSKVSKLKIDQCTFFDAIGNGKYFANFNGSANIPEDFTISNSIFGGSDASINVRATNPKIESPFVVNSFRTSDFTVASNYPMSGISDYSKTSEDLFENAAEGIFKIIDITIGGDTQPGDPRWW